MRVGVAHAVGGCAGADAVEGGLVVAGLFGEDGQGAGERGGWGLGAVGGAVEARGD